jgi:hypothetical protein
VAVNGAKLCYIRPVGLGQAPEAMARFERCVDTNPAA